MGLELQQNDHDKAVRRIKQLHHNARCAFTTFDNWVEAHRNMLGPEARENASKPSAHLRFERYIYNIRTVGIMAAVSHSYEKTSRFLDTFAREELEYLYEFNGVYKFFIKYMGDPTDPELSDELVNSGYKALTHYWLKSR